MIIGFENILYSLRCQRLMALLVLNDNKTLGQQISTNGGQIPVNIWIMNGGLKSTRVFGKTACKDMHCIHKNRLQSELAV